MEQVIAYLSGFLQVAVIYLVPVLVLAAVYATFFGKKNAVLKPFVLGSPVKVLFLVAAIIVLIYMGWYFLST